MSWDVSIVDRNTNEVLNLKASHNLRGGTYVLGGTTEAYLNVTYNYGDIFRKVLPKVDGSDGIQSIHKMNSKDSIPLLKNAVAKLRDDKSDNYWEATEGNAQAALLNLIELAEKAPEGIWWVE
jgi:hypothetical protein